MSQTASHSKIGTENPGVMDSLIQTISEITPTPEQKHEDALHGPNGWPKKLWIIDLGNGLHGVIRHPPYGGKAVAVEGLAVFKYKANAQKFVHLVKDNAMSGHKFVKMTFEDAVKLVHTKPPIVTTLMLADEPTKPKIYQVK